jgi:hypothetical protein
MYVGNLLQLQVWSNDLERDAALLKRGVPSLEPTSRVGQEAPPTWPDGAAPCRSTRDRALRAGVRVEDLAKNDEPEGSKMRHVDVAHVFAL